MSIFHCARCGTNHDSDWVECCDTVEGLVCRDSMSEEEIEKYDAEELARMTRQRERRNARQ